MKKIILIGGGGHCRACIDVIRSTKHYEIVGILDTTDALGSSVLSVPVIGTDEDILTLSTSVDAFFISIGHVHSSERRKQLFDYLKDNGLSLATIVSPLAYVAEGVSIGEGSIVMHQALLNTNAVVSDNCIVNSKALIEHDARLGSHSHLSTAAIINGESTVGSACFVGSNAVVNLGLEITDNVNIASSSLVTKSIHEPGVYKGVPVSKT